VKARLTADLRRTQLLDRALPLFAIAGYRGTTTARIVKAAGVTPPILYRHFSGKRDLFEALLEHAADKVLDSWRAAAEGIPSPALRRDAIARAAAGTLPAMKVLLRALGEREGEAALRRAINRLHRFLCSELKAPPRDAWALMESWTGRALLGPLRGAGASR
jgi:AcrR family transcriptional regulator